MDRTTSLRDLWALVAALACVQAAVAAIGLAIPFWLREEGATSLAIGLVTSCYMAGFLLGARLAPARIARLGHIRAFVFFAALAGLAALCFGLSASIFSVAVVEFILGFAVAGLFASGESWIADSAPVKGRGRIIGLYYLIAKIGMIAGPFLVASARPGEAAAFMIVAALLFAAILPVAATRQAQPTSLPARPFTLADLWREAPGSVQAALVAGLVNGAVLQLYPVYVAAIAGGGAAAAAGFVGCAQAGSLCSQWPAGIYSDRIDRRLVIAALAGLAALAAFALAIWGEALPLVALLALAALWGAGGLSYYGIAVAHAVDRAGDGQATSAIAGLLLLWALGAVAGPATAGALMTLWLGPSGLFHMAGGLLALLCALMLVRRATQRPASVAAKEPFAPVSTTSVNLAELDPRG